MRYQKTARLLYRHIVFNFKLIGSGPMYYNNRYNSSEAFIHDMKGWDIDARKLDRGNFLGTLSFIDCQLVKIIRFNFNSIIGRIGSSPEGYVSFVIPGKSNQSYHWLNKEVDSTIIAKFSESRELNMFSKGDFDSIGLNIESTHFQKLLEQYQFQHLHKVLQKEDQLFQKSVYEVNQLANFVHKLFLTIKVNPLLINKAEFKNKVQFFLPYLLMDLLEKSSDYKPNRKSNESDLVLQETVSYINQNIYKRLSLANLSKFGGFSERTLTSAFNQKFGLSPYRYINRTKLNLIRKELSDQKNSETIKSIIQKFGIKHSGQFSKDYYNLFHELPSDTRRRPAWHAKS